MNRNDTNRISVTTINVLSVFIDKPLNSSVLDEKQTVNNDGKVRMELPEKMRPGAEVIQSSNDETHLLGLLMVDIDLYERFMEMSLGLRSAKAVFTPIAD